MSACVDTYYFLGIGGIGMSALARYFASEGYRVMGYDRTCSALTRSMENEGIAIQYDDSTAWVELLDKERTLVVRTPAVPEDEAIFCYLRQHGFDIRKRAEVLGQVTKQKKALCVAGTHGKTTTSTMLAHLLRGTEWQANAFLGGIANNYGTNVLLDNESDYVVVEADEFDRSFHQLIPYISVITSMDPDHLDIYGTEKAYKEGFEKYAGLVQKALVVKAALSQCIAKAAMPQCKVYSYGVGEKADFYADNVRVTDGQIFFDFHTPEQVMTDMHLGQPVMVNVENSVAAMAVAWLLGAREELRKGLSSFAGVYRRFNMHVNTDTVAYVDDYAHHPKELSATITSARVLYPHRHVIGIFQPHLFSRTRDFADDFAAVLSEVDELILLPIYPARELPITGVTSEWLMQKVQEHNGHAKSVRVVQKTALAAYLQERLSQLNNNAVACVVLTMGAGDIENCVATITEILK